MQQSRKRTKEILYKNKHKDKLQSHKAFWYW